MYVCTSPPSVGRVAMGFVVVSFESETVVVRFCKITFSKFVFLVPVRVQQCQISCGDNQVLIGLRVLHYPAIAFHCFKHLLTCTGLVLVVLPELKVGSVAVF